MSTPERSTATTALIIAGATVLGGLAAYAVYFDYKRRNDAQFRKQLRKEQKRVKRAKTETAAAASVVTDDALKAALLAIRGEPLPDLTADREGYFTLHIGEGERLSTQGPSTYLDAALHFYRALRVYPAPVELIMIYQKTVPEPIFNILMKLTTFDVSVSGPLGAGQGSTQIPIIYEDAIDDAAPAAAARSGPPSETSSSVDWDKIIDTGTNSPTHVSPPP